MGPGFDTVTEYQFTKLVRLNTFQSWGKRERYFLTLDGARKVEHCVFVQT